MKIEPGKITLTNQEILIAIGEYVIRHGYTPTGRVELQTTTHAPDMFGNTGTVNARVEVAE